MRPLGQAGGWLGHRRSLSRIAICPASSGCQRRRSAGTAASIAAMSCGDSTTDAAPRDSTSRSRRRAPQRDDVFAAGQDPRRWRAGQPWRPCRPRSRGGAPRVEVALEVAALKRGRWRGSPPAAVGSPVARHQARERDAVSGDTDAEFAGRGQDVLFDARETKEYSICRSETGWMAWARRRVSAPTSERPMWRL